MPSLEESFSVLLYTHTHTHTHTHCGRFRLIQERAMTGRGWAWDRWQLPWWCVCVCVWMCVWCLIVSDCPSPGPSVWVWMGVWSVSVFLTQFLRVKQITLGNAHKLWNSKFLSPKLFKWKKMQYMNSHWKACPWHIEML